MDFVQRTIELARMNVEAGGRPFSCVIVKDEAVLAEGVNLVAQTQDPTAHAEICAIREATAKLQTEHLMGCEFYILAHPCPMCLAARYYTREEYGASIRMIGNTFPLRVSTMNSASRGTSAACRFVNASTPRQLYRLIEQMHD
jgi:Cytidine and deoxycytidylate deaminase zinc-binding region